MKKLFISAIAISLIGCGGKTVSDTKKQEAEKAPVISVLDAPSDPKAGKAAGEVLDSPKFTPTAQPTQASIDKNSPKQVIQSYTDELQSLYKETRTNQNKAQDQKIATKVRRFFDFETLARLSLGTNWGKLNPKKQREYSELFVELIEKSYLKRSRNLVGSYSLSFGNEKITGNQATVDCSIFKDDADLDIVYQLQKGTNNWMIYNIVFDQVDLAKNYQTQFNKIIADQGVEKLLKLMKKKLSEKEDPTAGANL